ncbi:MAG TPA: sigma 54-interacting transcriptional regulator, partial [Methylibium sp.]|nr:sigma 54-interacting transcriptional regulator [Methylibium sp.]
SLMDLLDLSFDGLWAIARGQASGEVCGLYPCQNERYYPAVIAPRTRAGSTLRVMPARLPTSTAVAAPRVGALDRLAGDDPAMQRLIGQAKRLVDSKVSLLIHGETGSGKEVLAKALHDHSSRAHKPFIAVNCASIPESLIESELFGYTPGSFTGGRSKGMKGLIAQSDGGTLFLDEIGDMPLHLQTRFLRVLSEQEVLPLGAEQPIAVDLNVIAATHRDLRGCIERASFREDLYYRLSGATLQLPPLRERRDIGWLIDTIFAEEAARLGVQTALLPEARERLSAHNWPGNIRELRNALRFALALAGERPVSPDELPAGLGDALPAPAAPLDEAYAGLDLDVDADRLLRVLRKHKWSITATAQELDVCRATVYRQMKRYRITPPNQL